MQPDQDPSQSLEGKQESQTVEEIPLGEIIDRDLSFTKIFPELEPELDVQISMRIKVGSLATFFKKNQEHINTTTIEQIVKLPGDKGYLISTKNKSKYVLKPLGPLIKK